MVFPKNFKQLAEIVRSASLSLVLPFGYNDCTFVDTRLDTTLIGALTLASSEQKALDEALKIGLRGDELKKFAQTYIAQHKAKHG